METTSVLPPAFMERPSTVAHSVAAFLARSGVRRIYGLTGGHIKPLWDEASRAGIRIVDVRHEAAAVHMAQADADLTGELAVATVTAGPGLTNAVTGIANAYQCRSPILVMSGLPPRSQLGLGAVEELPQAEIVRPITRWARTVTHVRQAVPFLHAAFRAAVGDDGPSGPAYLDFPIDVLRGPAANTAGEAPFGLRSQAAQQPAPDALKAAEAALRSSRRPLLISGRGAAGDPKAVQRFLETTGALYLDTGESRGLVAPDHPAYVPAMRSRAMAEADLVITAGRRVDFALAFGSQAIFRSARNFVRIGRNYEELGENRPGDVQIKGDVPAALRALVDRDISPTQLDASWRDEVCARDRDKREQWQQRTRNQPLGADGRIHPNALLQAINDTIDPTMSILISDGGDILSFARVGLVPPARLDPGPFGCLGVGIPFAVSASLNHPDKTVVAVVGDGSFGFNAMELDTARRTGANPVIVIANNESWNIERIDQIENFEGNVFGTELPSCQYDLLARSLGLHSERVTSLDRLRPALEEAIRQAPAVVDVAVSREPRSPDFTAGLAELPDLHALRTWDNAERTMAKGAGQ